MRLDNDFSTDLCDPDIWRGFHDEFEALAREELATARAGIKGEVLVAYVSYEGTTNDIGDWLVYGTPSERLRSDFDSIAARAGLALHPPRGVNPAHYWLRSLFLDLLGNRSKYLLFAKAPNESGIIQPVCAASAMFCNRLVAKSAALVAAQIKETVRQSRAHEKPVAVLSDNVRLGRRRAKLVAKLIKELNALRPHMQIADEDYSRLRNRFPKYQVFKICERNPSASEFVKRVADRPRVHTLAYELAAVHFGIAPATVKTAWKRYKPKASRGLKRKRA